MPIQVLVLEDEEPIRGMVDFALSRAGFEVVEAGDVQQAEHAIGNQLPDLMLVDWMLPGISGVEFIRRLKRDELTKDIPVIMLTARTEEDDKVRGLDTGADDYLTKPFSTRELVARIRALLRRSSVSAEDGVMRVANLMLDLGSHNVEADGCQINLGPTEFRLLRFFMGHTNRVYSRGQLLDFVWGRNAYIEERTVDVHVFAVCAKLYYLSVVPTSCKPSVVQAIALYLTRPNKETYL